MDVPRWVFQAGWSAGTGREGLRMRELMKRGISSSTGATGTTKPRDGEPVRSGPVAASKQESARHVFTITTEHRAREAGRLLQGVTCG
jgi:hypothetical protein